jgi:hypothetical protein
MRIRVLLTAMLLPLLASGCVEQRIEEGQVRSALVDAGLSPAISRCMAYRMVDRLTVKQLRKLQALQGPKRTVGDYIAAVRRVDDPEALQVAISSAALCVSGWER